MPDLVREGDARLLRDARALEDAVGVRLDAEGDHNVAHADLTRVCPTGCPEVFTRRQLPSAEALDALHFLGDRGAPAVLAIVVAAALRVRGARGDVVARDGASDHTGVDRVRVAGERRVVVVVRDRRA